jgi:hypothetical protein
MAGGAVMRYSIARRGDGPSYRRPDVPSGARLDADTPCACDDDACGWRGKLRELRGEDGDCPECGGTVTVGVSA